MIDVQLNSTQKKIVDIRVIGVGGGGTNSVNRMVEYEKESGKRLELVEYIIANTDIQSLENNNADKKIKLGLEGVGAGMDPEKAKQAALSTKEEIKEAIKGAQMLFIVAGMGGGTGTGASPEIAKLAREEGILTVAIVTRPFPFEGKKRMMLAEAGINELTKEVDTIIILENGRLSKIGEKNETWASSLKKADNVLKDAVRAVVEIIEDHSFINADFADVEKVLRNKGYGHMSVGVAKGEDRMVKALEMAIHSPLLVRDIRGFSSCLYLVKTAKNGLLTGELRDIGDFIEGCGREGADIIVATAEDESCAEDELIITIISAGFDDEELEEIDPEEVQEPQPRNMGIEKLREKFKLPSQLQADVRQSVFPNKNHKKTASESSSTLYDNEMEKRAKAMLNPPLEDEFDSIFRGDRVNLNERPSRKESEGRHSSDGLLIDSYLKIDRSKYE